MKNAFYFNKEVPFVLKIFNFLDFPLPLFFPLSGIADFIEGANWE